MNQAQMKKRCPRSKYLGIATLQGYRLVFDGYSERWHSATANIVKDSSEIIKGALYELTDQDIEKLDEYEPTYLRQRLRVNYKSDTPEAFVYYREPQILGKPSDEYLATMGLL